MRGWRGNASSDTDELICAFLASNGGKSTKVVKRNYADTVRDENVDVKEHKIG